MTTGKLSDEEVQQQIKDVMRTQLKGVWLSSSAGPNGSELQFWVIQGGTVIVQRWSDGNGWAYYPPGRQGKVDWIAADIKLHFKRKVKS